MAGCPEAKRAKTVPPKQGWIGVRGPKEK